MRPKPAVSRRVTRFQVRLSLPEQAELEQTARKLRISKGELIRQGVRLLAANQASKLASGE